MKDLENSLIQSDETKNNKNNNELNNSYNFCKNKINKTIISIKLNKNLNIIKNQENNLSIQTFILRLFKKYQINPKIPKPMHIYIPKQHIQIIYQIHLHQKGIK